MDQSDKNQSPSASSPAHQGPLISSVQDQQAPVRPLDQIHNENKQLCGRLPEDRLERERNEGPPLDQIHNENKQLCGRLPEDRLERERNEGRRSVELYRKRCTSDKTELYQLVGFYSVFQGVVFGAVATSAKTILTCQTSLLPALLSLLVSVGTAVSVHFKLQDYEIDKRKFLKSENLAEFAQDKLQYVKDGIFSFTTIEMRLEERNKQKLQQDARSHRKFYWIVMLFLFVFSVTVMACCVLIRCWEFDQDQSKLMLCAFTTCWEKNVTVTIHKF